MTMKSYEELKDVDSLQELFKLWKEEQQKEANGLNRNWWDNKKENTIPSHFKDFIERCRRCEKCTSIENSWRDVLGNAFNMDGYVGEIAEAKEPYEYETIILLKEANDSAKTCIADYLENKSICNEWLSDWKDGNAPGNVSMLNKLCKACTGGCADTNKNKFIGSVAYMNINKRGGGSHAEDHIIINYAKKYKDYIKREIYLLADENANIYVGGGKKYFRNLMDALEIFGKFSDEESSMLKVNFTFEEDNKKITFIQIPHPSFGGADMSKIKRVNM